ncbi:hypothetical protein PC116_g16121 [Phytophthora cactorum]|nr:hypothetical protein PC116_g16121 [Phytophthora cactorum]
MLARAALTATALLAFAQNPGAHGNIKEPKATFTNGAPIVQWVMIDNFWVIGIGGDQVGKFKTMAKEKGMGFNDVVLDMVKDKKWGYTSTDVDSQPVPSDGKVKWLANGGGACELYIDDKMVPHGDDSEEEFPGGLDGAPPPPLPHRVRQEEEERRGFPELRVPETRSAAVIDHRHQAKPYDSASPTRHTSRHTKRNAHDVKRTRFWFSWV